MMNFAIVAGGVLGLLAGGWHGLVIGAAAGYFLAWVAPQLLNWAMADRVRGQFMDSTFAVMGAMCKVDGRVTYDEIAAAEQLFDQLALFGEERERAKLSFERGKTASFDIDAEVKRFNRAARGQREIVQMFLQVQLAAISADGIIDPAEDKLLLRVARGLGLSALELERLKAFLRPEQQQSSSYSSSSSSSSATPDAFALKRAYQVLGVEASASDGEVKFAYRKLMSKNHPDKLASRGLPESMRPMAELKTREITAAYECIQDARGKG